MATVREDERVKALLSEYHAARRAVQTELVGYVARRLPYVFGRLGVHRSDERLREEVQQYISFRVVEHFDLWSAAHDWQRRIENLMRDEVRHAFRTRQQERERHVDMDEEVDAGISRRAHDEDVGLGFAERVTREALMEARRVLDPKVLKRMPGEKALVMVLHAVGFENQEIADYLGLTKARLSQTKLVQNTKDLYRTIAQSLETDGGRP